MKRIVCTTLLVETSPQAMPLGAACIASAIKADPRTAGAFSVELRDFSLEDGALAACRTDGEKAVYIARALAGSGGLQDAGAASGKAGGLSAVCFSVYVWNHRLLEATARELKKLIPGLVCIAGGPEVTANPLVFSAFDYTIAGQGEGAVPALLSELFLQEDGRPAPIQGVYALLSQGAGRPQPAPCRAAAGTAATGSASATGSSAADAVIRALPCLPGSLSSPYLDGTLDPARYGGALWELARGCPFKCSYCYESKGESKIAYFPLERLEKELELFAAKDIAQVFVLDPTYNANKKRAVDMLRLIEKKTPRTFFYFEARAEFIDRELARAFSRIPCALQIGLQSADPAVLKNVHRTLDKKLFTRNIGFLNEAGVTFGFDLIYGLPGDSYPGFLRSMDFALSLYPNNLELFCLSVLPGTTLHDDAPLFGMEWEKEPPYHVIRTPQFSKGDLARAARVSGAANLFYNDGRAVPWFNSLLHSLHKKPSAFFEDFAAFLETGPGLAPGAKKPGKAAAAGGSLPLPREHSAIEGLQCAFIENCYRAARLEKLLPAALDLIRMNGAISRATADGSESRVSLHYHPDDIMSEYALDLDFFAANCGREQCTARVFVGKQGVDWRLEKETKKRQLHQPDRFSFRGSGFPMPL